MPVTAQLSKAFYERLGEEVANELVDWFNQVDATYRSDLRELNELNFARFDAKLEQRIAELRSTLREEMAALGSTLREEIAKVRTDTQREIHGAETRLLKWMFVSWATTIGTLITLLRLWG